MTAQTGFRAAIDSEAAWLIGRELELAALRIAVRDPDVRSVVLRGPPGAGKSALAQAILEWAVEDRALTGSGKYPEGDGPAPFEPIIRALSGAVALALDQLYEPGHMTAAMRDSLGPALSVLFAAGFNAGIAPPPTPVAPIISRRQRTAQLIDASVKLVRWLGRFERPIVLVIDDWRRGGAEGRSLLGAIVAETTGLTLLLTERDVPDSHDFGEGAQDMRPPFRLIEVGPLADAGTQELFETALGDACSGGAPALMAWLAEDCPRLPYDILTFAHAVTTSNALVRTDDVWQVDAARAASLGRTEIAQNLATRLTTLSAQVRFIATVAALWGDSAPLLGLQLALGISETHLACGLLVLEEVGIVRQERDEVSFLHDRVRAAVLAAWASGELKAVAGDLAERLASAPITDWPTVSVVALRWRRLGGLEDINVERWRPRFADGAASARARLDFHAATDFAEAGWCLRSLGKHVDGDEDRRLVREAVLSAADRNDKAEVNRRAHELVRIAQDDSSLGEAYEISIAALRLAGDPEGAWTFAEAGLMHFGVSLPNSVSRSAVFASAMIWKLERQFHRRDDDSGITAPVGAFTRISNAAATLAFERSPSIAALLALRGSRRAGRGKSRDAFWLATDTFLSAMTGNFAEASRIGHCGAELASRPDYDGFAHAATLYRSLYWGPVWTQPQATLRHRCLEVRDLALAEGDLVQAAVALRNWIAIGWRSGISLVDLQIDIYQAERELALLGDSDAIAGVAMIAAAVNDATSPPGRPLVRCALGDNARDPERLIALESAAFRGDWDAAVHIAPPSRGLGRNLDSHPGGVVWRFHIALAQLKRGDRPRRADLAFVQRAAQLNPSDHRGKALLLVAEGVCQRRGAKAALPAFAKAAAAAFHGSSRLEAGLAAEAAEAAARLAGNSAAADRFHSQAQQVWLAWGATAKLTEAAEDIAAASVLGLNLREAQARVAESERTDRAKSRLLAEVAHELRTPMQAMQSLLDLAAEAPQPPDFRVLSAVFGSLTTVIDDLTEYGAFSTGVAPLKLAPTDIVELVRSECTVARAFAAIRGAAVAVEVADDTIEFVEIDGVRVRQVLRNLLSNAAKYGGQTIVVTLSRSKRDLVVVVEDDGAGLTESELVCLFEPFQRGSRAADALGMGLGLSLSRRIAMRMGGELSAENRPEGGVRFVFRFSAETVSPLPTETTGSLSGLRLLLADDSELIRESIGTLMRRRGAVVIEVGDGEAALDHLRAGFINVAIIDLSMPRLGGMDVLHKFRSEAGGDLPLPIIVLTASSEPALLAAARAAGAQAVLRKPVSAADLGRALVALGLATHEDSVTAPDIDANAVPNSAIELAAAVRQKLAAVIPNLLSRVAAGRATSDEAHLVAGLAAQFGWSAIAEAADALEHALETRASTSPSEMKLAKAVADMNVAGYVDGSIWKNDEAEPESEDADHPNKALCSCSPSSVPHAEGR